MNDMEMFVGAFFSDLFIPYLQFYFDNTKKVHNTIIVFVFLGGGGDGTRGH